MISNLLEQPLLHCPTGELRWLTMWQKFGLWVGFFTLNDLKLMPSILKPNFVLSNTP